MRYIILVLLAFLIGCEQQQQAPTVTANDAATPAYGDTFIEASIGEPSNLLPVLSSDSPSSDINQLVYNGLIRYDKSPGTSPKTTCHSRSICAKMSNGMMELLLPAPMCSLPTRCTSIPMCRPPTPRIFCRSQKLRSSTITPSR